MKKIILIFVVITLTVGACDVRPANTTTTTFVVWDPEILATVGITPQVTAADLIQQEGSPTMSASRIAALENSPSLQLLIGTPAPAGGVKRRMVAHIIEQMEGQWGDPTSTREPPPQRPPGGGPY